MYYQCTFRVFYVQLPTLPESGSDQLHILHFLCTHSFLLIFLYNFSCFYLKHPLDRQMFTNKFIQTCTGNDRLRILDTSSKYVLRLLSSSDKTSSSSRIGDSFITSLINWICASFKESAAVRCCPWEPYLRISIPFTIKLISSLCGPTVVVEYFKSFVSSLQVPLNNYHTLHRSHIPVKFFFPAS